MRQNAIKANTIICVVCVVLFLALSLLPSLGMLITGETQPSANEILASKPSVVSRDGELNRKVLNDFSSYIADRFAFRKDLVSAWSELNAKLFRTSVEEQVVLGTDGWLFFAPTLDDYMGRAMSEEELSLAASYLAALQREAESRGVRFYFTIAPNKNSLYPEHMPSYIPTAHRSSNAEKLKPYLEQFGVNYVDLFAVYAGVGETLYYRTDSHWTERGAALAADTLLAAMEKDSAFFSAEFRAGEPHRGDLYEMLYPAGKEREASEICAAGFSYTLSGDPNGGNAMRIRSSCEGRSGTLLCWRDSFGISLYPYLADSFSEAVFLRSASYDLSQIESTGADTVLIELVERNLGRLAEAGHKMTESTGENNDA